ncbi:MAG TPA: hypothetical protein VK618_13850 [Flavitalea sp.]|nr:hypothetical protein [Flavitalea sp.]
MNKRKFKPWLLFLLFFATAVVIAGAWAKTTHRAFADNLLGAGLAGIIIVIIMLTALFGTKNRPSNWLK